MRIRLLLAVLAAALTTFVGGPAHAARPAAVRALTFNVCGNVCRDGEVANTSANVAFRIRRLNASLTMLQEICYSQFLAVQARLAKYGYSAMFAAAADGGRCDDHDHSHGTRFGVAIIARGKLTAPFAHRLPSPDPWPSEGRVVLAATWTLAGRTVFVATSHLSLSDENRDAQLAAISRWLAPIAASRPALFGGDLNIFPEDPDLDGLYTSFREANDNRVNPIGTFVPTSRKIDYLFGSRRFLAPRGVARAGSGYSDHYMYVGDFRLSPA